MDWKDLAGTLVKAGAPIIGGALGGPVGALIGGGLGSVIANALGVDNTPEAVNNAIATGEPSVVSARLSAAESEAVAKWPALAEIAKAEAGDRTAQSQAINATMQREVAAGQPWYAWRNLYGYSVVLEATATSWVILYALVVQTTIFHNVSESFNFFMSWYGLRFGLLGFIYRGSSNEKIAAVTGEAPGVIKSIAKAILKK